MTTSQYCRYMLFFSRSFVSWSNKGVSEIKRLFNMIVLTLYMSSYLWRRRYCFVYGSSTDNSNEKYISEIFYKFLSIRLKCLENIHFPRYQRVTYSWCRYKYSRTLIVLQTPYFSQRNMILYQHVSMTYFILKK